ncbi:MAG: efflux RND transporter periplasmic adaptor subunit [Pseudomonadota bacterium]
MRILLLGCLLWVALARAETLDSVNVQYREVDQTYAVDGLIEAVRQSTVAAQIAGRVVELNFDVGDYVQKGQVIARIDAREASQAVAGSQAQAAQAQANLANARAHYERTRQLFEQKFVSQAALDKAQAEYQAAQAQAKATLAGAGQAETVKGYATIVAPYSGVVAARHVELGEMASPGKPLFTGFDPRDLRVEVSIPQYKLDAVRRSASAMIEIATLDKWVKAAAVTVLPAADVRTHTTRVRLDLPADLRGVQPGMYVRAHFSVGRARKLVIPVSAVLRRSEVSAVYVVDTQGRPQLRQVRLGEPAGHGLIEVLAGVVVGENVALDPVKAGILLKGGGEQPPTSSP